MPRRTIFLTNEFIFQRPLRDCDNVEILHVSTEIPGLKISRGATTKHLITSAKNTSVKIVDHINVKGLSGLRIAEC